MLIRAVAGGAPREVIFTKNATEALNLVAYAWGEPNIKAGDEIGIDFLPDAGLGGSDLVVGAANAVNFTDGLDGLAIVPVMIAAATFLLFVATLTVATRIVSGLTYLLIIALASPCPLCACRCRRPSSAWSTPTRFSGPARSASPPTASFRPRARRAPLPPSVMADPPTPSQSSCRPESR